MFALRLFGQSGGKPEDHSADCNLQIYECGHCGRRGCNTQTCTKCQFLPKNDACKDCGRPFDMKYVGDARALAEKPKPTNPDHSLRPAATPMPPPMGVVLGVGAFAVAVFALSFLSLRGGGLGGHSPVRLPSIDAPAQSASASGATSMTYANYDVCGCFSEGRRLAASSASVLSPDYRLGYVSCRAALGPTGGLYWTAGWNSLRARANGAPQSCRAVR